MRPELILGWLLPAIAAPVLFAVDPPRSGRRWSLAVACVVLGASVAVLVSTASAEGARIELELGGIALAADGTRAVLASVVALVVVGALAFAPRRSISARTGAVILLGEAGTLLALHARTPWVVLVGWAVSAWPLLVAADRAASRLARLTIGVSILAALGGVVGELLGASSQLVSWAWIVAALARLGAPPFHPWVVTGLHRAPPAIAVPTIVSPLPLMVLGLVTPSLPAGSALPIVLLGVGAAGAVFASLVAIVQHDLRRALAYLHVSFVSTLVAAIGSATAPGVAGALLAGVSATLAVSGLVFLAGAVEARAGTGDMRHLGGLNARLSLAGAGFLVFGLTALGFPGTIGFVTEDLVIQGLMTSNPVIAVVVLVAAAVNGITLFRCYKRTFLGPSEVRDARPLVMRERVIGLAWAFVILVGGLLPAPLLAIRSTVDHAFEDRPGGPAIEHERPSPTEARRVPSGDAGGA